MVLRKFKAKSEKTGEWIYWDLEFKDGIVTCVSPERIFFDTICQSFGYKDDNGKEIYESDIVECTDSNGDKYILCVSYKGDVLSIDFASDIWMPDGIEHIKVLGNRFDNPELLKPGIRPIEIITELKIDAGTMETIKEFRRWMENH